MRLDPAELDRLALRRLARHPLALAEDEERLAHAESARVREEQVHGDDVRRVADVDRDRRAVLLEEREAAAAELGAVLDVVVHEEGVVEELERRRREERLLGAAAGGAAGGEADRGPEPLPLAERVVGEQVVERPVAGAPAAVEEPLEGDATPAPGTPACASMTAAETGVPGRNPSSVAARSVRTPASRPGLRWAPGSFSSTTFASLGWTAAK